MYGSYLNCDFLGEVVSYVVVAIEVLTCTKVC